jgi:hypothetical protein
MSIDLSSLPPISTPTKPSNTLLITNLKDTEIFRPDNLQTIRDLINTSAPIHVWAPLKSFRRIIVSFMDDESAARIRHILDGEEIMGVAVKVYFGQPTPIEPRDEHLHLPDAGKLFFISPPPSPPHGWEVKLEGAPNKLVHADDLAEALANLHQRAAHNVQPQSSSNASSRRGTTSSATRHARSGSTTIYNPSEHGLSPDLPAIEVEDLSGDSDVSPIEDQRAMFTHTQRPPVELMQE